MSKPNPPQEVIRQNAAASQEEQVHFPDAPNGLLGMAADLSNLFSSFEILAGDPGNLQLRQAVVRNARNIAVQFNHSLARLSGVEYGLNTSIQKDVVRANYHLHDIASFNQQIVDTLAVGGCIEPWAGQRERCLDALSSCVNHTPIPQADGSITISIGGVTMVEGAERPDCLATYPDRHGNLCLQAQNSSARLKLAGGSITRKLTVRDGSVAHLRKGLNALAAQLISRVNSIYSSGCDLKGRNFFTGSDASDIGVDPTVAGNAAPWQAMAAGETDGNRMVARALAKLGSRKFQDLGRQALREEEAQAAADLDEALAIVNDSFNRGREVPQMQALGAALDGETANFMRYQQACASSARVITTLDEMAPMH